MKFDPALPDDRVNLAEGHPVRDLVSLVVGIAAVVGALVVVIALTIDVIVTWIPPSFEARLFAGQWVDDGLAGEGEGADPRSPELTALLGRLAGHWPDNPYALRLVVREGEAPNAVALPGGLVVVTTGLLDQVGSENELAFVLGHEIGHFRNRDHLRGLGRGAAFALVMSALGGGGDGVQLAAFVGALTERGFGREQETAADVVGLELVEAEYGHVSTTWEFFEQLPQPDGRAEREFVHYFSTHPLSEQRIDALEALAEERGWSRSGTPTPLP